MIFQSVLMILPRFFDFERRGPWAKIIKSEATFFVAMSMLNKCAKFHKDSPRDKKVKFNLPSVIELLETAVLGYNFVQKPYASEQLRWPI